LVDPTGRKILQVADRIAGSLHENKTQNIIDAEMDPTTHGLAADGGLAVARGCGGG
jgi:hypothetical protein